MSLSTHVLDTAKGRPAAGVRVRVERADGAVLAEGVTDGDGRIGKDWLAPGLPEPGPHRLVFDTGGYLGEGAFFPEVTVVFTVARAEAHHHIPLLLSPFAYSTYRGS
ncbi:hydroxyisourate hydrolase [Rhizohabitans arisaemae]|uniref:hydroxyisourate hydrolase n=1 Tax=Rhizohabitans arisaemae TaxID=2720610 RepID=UPI0024B247DA|nr:hydroxyisourate hydrolase [Rhizohabitans arisaemae]